MARRKGGIADLLEIASKLPWQISAALIPLTFLGCHWVAIVTALPLPANQLADMGGVVVHTAIHFAASIFQIGLPVAFFFGAVASYIHRSNSAQLYNRIRADPSIDVAAMSWRDFEILVGEGFRHRGFQVTERGGTGPDGGVDLVLRRGRERHLVQCKQWRAQQVNVSVVRELYGVMAAEQAAGGYVVTSGNFTKDAKGFAAGKNIELVDGVGLEELLRDGKRAAAVDPERSRVKQEALVDIEPKESDAPMCPRCQTPMVVRVAKRGNGVGSSFWGCSQFPRCRQTVSIN